MPVWRTTIILSFVFAERGCISCFSFYRFSRWMINGCVECLLTSELGNCVIVCGRLELNGFKIQRGGERIERMSWEMRGSARAIKESRNRNHSHTHTHTVPPCAVFVFGSSRVSRRNGNCLKWRNRTGELLKEGIICSSATSSGGGGQEWPSYDPIQDSLLVQGHVSCPSCL